MEKQATKNPSLDLIAITKDNWPEKLSKLKNKYPSIKMFKLEFKESKGNTFIDEVYAKIGNTTGKTIEEFHKLVNSL